MTMRQGARSASHAQAAWRSGRAGIYVANASTGIIVAGPFADDDEAELVAAEHEPPAMMTVEAE